MKTCENCGERIYSLGCTWCNEEAYIEEQESRTEISEREVLEVRRKPRVDRGPVSETPQQSVSK